MIQATIIFRLISSSTTDEVDNVLHQEDVSHPIVSSTTLCWMKELGGEEVPQDDDIPVVGMRGFNSNQQKEHGPNQGQQRINFLDIHIH